MSAPGADSISHLTTPSGAVYSLYDSPHLNFGMLPLGSIKYRHYTQEHETNSIPTVETDISNLNAPNEDPNFTIELARKLVFGTIIGYHGVLRKFAGLRTVNQYRLNVIYGQTEPGNIFLSRSNLDNVPDRINPDDMQESIVYWILDQYELTYQQCDDFVPFFKHSIHGLHASGIVSFIINIGNRSPTEAAIKGSIYTTLAWLAKWATEAPGAYAVVVTIKVSTACETAVLSLLDPIPGDLTFLGGSPILGDMRDKVRMWRFSTQDIENLCPDEGIRFIPASDRLYLKMMVG